MLFRREDLLNNHYTWKTDNSKELFAGSASRRRFDRFSGEQVLFIINLCAESVAAFTLAKGHILENMIFNELPMETKSELSVFNWLVSVNR